jgi:hypothetical protein
VFIQPILLREEAEMTNSPKVQPMTMSHTKPADEIRRSIDLTPEEITQLRAPAMSLPVGWDVKVVRMGVTRNPARAAYFFRTGPALDASPTVVVVRNAEAYLVITYDVVSWLQEPTVEVLICMELSEVVAIVHSLICEVVEADDDAS